MASYRAFYISGPGTSWKDKLRVAALIAVGGAVLLAALVLSLGIALVLVPVGLVAYLFRRQILRAMVGSLQQRAQPAAEGFRPETGPQSGPVTIETEYRIVERDSDRRS